MPRLPASPVLHVSLALVLLGPAQTRAQTAAFAPNSVAKATAATADSVPSKAATVLPDLFTGTFSYAIPVDVPRGRRGIQPEVHLRYRSIAGDAGIGMGWSVELGAVERSMRYGVRFDGDEFVLRDQNGVSDLVRIATGLSDSEYRSIIETDFRRVKRVGDYFEATDRNGVKYLYGQSSASRQFDKRLGQSANVFRWYVDRIEDPNGNFLTVSYKRDPANSDTASQAAVYIDRIDYGGGTNQAPNASVTFNWEFRSDAAVSYAIGFPVRMRYRLRSIEVRAGGALVRAYQLEYLANGPFTNRARLKSIQEFGSDATVAPDGVVTGPSSLPPTSFSYHEGGTPTDAKLAGPTWRIGGDQCDLNDVEHDVGRAVTGDFDGDGRTDLAMISGWNGVFPMSVYYGGANGLGAASEPGPNVYVAGDHAGLITGEHRVKTGDFNGDGRTDIAILNGWDGVFPMTIYYAKPAMEGRGFLEGVPGPSLYTAGDHEGARIDAGRVLVADFNGDGRSDLLTIEGWNSAARGGYQFPWRLYLSNPASASGFDDPRDTSIRLFMPDDHAGLWDVLARTKIGDFNGDGKVDVAYIDGWETWNTGGRVMSIWYANDSGTDFVWRPGPLRAVGGDHDAVRIDAGRIIPGDFNGDGKVDLIAADGWNSGGTPTAMRLYLSNGNGFDAPASVGPSLYYPDDAAGMYDVIARFKPGDFNGDGKTDLAIVEGWSGPNEMSIYLSTGTGFKDRIPGPNRVMGGSHEMVRLDAARVIVGDYDGDGKHDLAGLEGCQGATVHVGGRPPPGGYEIPPVPAGNYPISLYLAPSSPPDLLASINNNHGGSTQLDYLSSSHYANRQLPLIIQTLASMTTSVVGHDGTTTAATTSFTYSGGYFHIGERDFRGFAYAKMVDPPGHNGERLVREMWFHQGNGVEPVADEPSAPTGYMKGRPWRSRLSDNAAPSTFKQTVTTYWPDASSSGGWAAADGAAPWFTPVRMEETTTSDAGVITLQTRTEFADYDDYGNLEREEQYGDLTDGADDRTIVRTFQPNIQSWIVALPATEDVYHGATKLTGKWLYYDGIPQVAATASEQERRALCADNSSVTAHPTKGNITRKVSWLHACDQAGVCTEGPNPETRIGYDEFGNEVCSRTERGGITTIQYDTTATYPTIATNPLGHRIETSYYGVDTVSLDFGLFGQVKHVIDANLAASEVRYDALGRRTREILPGATSADGTALGLTATTWSYLTYGSDGRRYVRTEAHAKPGPIGAIGSLDDASRVGWSESYLDGADRPVKSRRPGADGRTVVEVRRLDGRGAIVSQSDPFFETGDVQRDTTFAFDAFGRVISTARARGTVATCYSGGISVTIDENLHRRRETRDAGGRLVRVEEYLGTYPLPCDAGVGTPYAATRYEYDPLGRLTLVTDAKGNMTKVAFDSLGRKRYLHDPDAGEMEYRYDASGNIVWQQDPNLRAFTALPGFERAITFEHDLLNRMTRKVYPNGTEVLFEYDLDVGPTDPTLPPSAPVGRLARMTDPSGRETFRYDHAGRVTRSIKDVSTAGSYVLRTDYDALGRAARLTYPTGDVVPYAFDAGGNLISVGSFVSYSGLNALGQPRFATYGNGVTTEMTYDATSRLLQTLTIDSPAGECVAGTGRRRCIALTHRYDAVGNVTSIADDIDPEQSQTFHYDELNRLDAASSRLHGAHTFAYDEIGNISRKDGVSYRYSSQPHTLVGTVGDRPHAVLATSGDAAPGRVRTIHYDLDNKPVSITRQGVTTSFTYDGAGNRVLKVSPQGASVYVKGIVECTAGACGIYVVAGGTRIALKTGAGVKYYHQNHAGSTVLVTGASGTALEQIAYQPYGETAFDSGSVSMNHKFTGQERDAETGLYYYGARYYDSALGRFISPDSVVPDAFDPQLLNRYAYVRNNPLRYVDPTGNEPVTIGVVFGVVIAIDSAVLYYSATAAVITAATLMAAGGGNINEGWVRTRDGAKSKAGAGWDRVRTRSDQAFSWAKKSWGGYGRVDGVQVLRKDIAIKGDDKYGHWWTEIGPTESYGWWPMEPVGLKGTLFGVPGELNGQTSFGGTAMMDPHHGDRGPDVDVFDVYAPPGMTPSQVRHDIRSFANSYSGPWSWPVGQNCHSFQEQLLQHLGLQVRPVAREQELTWSIEPIWGP